MIFVLHSPQGTRVCDVVFSVLPQFRDVHSGARFLTLSDPKYCGKMKVSSFSLPTVVKILGNCYVTTYVRLPKHVRMECNVQPLDLHPLDLYFFFLSFTKFKKYSCVRGEINLFTRLSFQVLEKLLSKFHDERAKVIIFSFSVQLLGIVQDYLVSRGYEYCRLDGSTKIEERTQIVNTFNSDPTQFVFLISKK